MSGPSSSRSCRSLASRGLAALLLLAALLVPPAPAWSQATPPAQSQDVDDALDLIRQQIDGAQQSLKNSDRLDDTELQSLRATALAAQAQANQISGQLTPQLAGLQARIAELGTPTPGTKEDPDVAAQRASLGKSRSTVDAQLKLARLLSVESDQLASTLWALRRSQFQARLGERTHSILAAPFWAELRDDLPNDATRIKALGSELAGAARGTPWAVWALAPVGVVLAAWALRWLRRRALAWLTGRAPAGRLRRSIYAMLVTLERTLGFGAVAWALGAVLDWNRTLSPPTAALMSNLTGMLWFGGFMYGVWSALLCSGKPSWRLLSIPDTVARSVRWFPPTLTVVSLTTWLAERLAVLINASLAMTVAINCVVALAMGLTVVLALMRGERLWRLELVKDSSRPRSIALAVVAGLNWLVVAAAVICILVGYVAFGSFAIKQVVWASIVLGAAYLLAALIDDVLMAWLVAAPPSEAADTPSEGRPTAQIAVLVSGLARVAVFLVALMLLLAPFGEGPSDLLRRSGQWQQGLKVGEFLLQPSAMLQALAVLVGGLGVVRVLRLWLAKRYLPATSLDAGMQASATSLFGYAGVVVAISLALSAVGIGLERIAWVASALSVGIGFGLQAVVQNFVSGLILLAERPVKVGDWVSLSGVEGDIRRINVRATEIQMGDRSTVIVPNSEFITKIVRNVTLANPIGLVQVKLPVPLGSDAEQVKALLLAAFDAHADVLDTPGPAVMLDGVDGGQLMFNATGYANSPRVTARVRSELLFDVLKRLAEAGINLKPPPTMLINAPAPVAASTP